MKQESNPKGQQYLKEKILNTDLCTGCGACVNLCPYQAIHKDQIRVLHSCDLKDCRGGRYCPRTPADLPAMKQDLFGLDFLTQELGAVREFWVTRAVDPDVRARGQHGGTITALIQLALEEGLIDTAVTAGRDNDLLSTASTVKDQTGILANAGSRFIVSPTVAAFNSLDLNAVSGVGVVATPCQALALAKMKLDPDSISGIKDKLKFVIGLFCGWALSWEATCRLLRENGINPSDVTGLDIPPSQYQVMEVVTKDKKIDIPLDTVTACIRPSCHYCDDLTAEFADISVGSARLPEGWEKARGWNHVIVRSKLGQKLIEKARSKGVLEFMYPVEGSLSKLKRAAAGKKLIADRNLEKKKDSSQK